MRRTLTLIALAAPLAGCGLGAGAAGAAGGTSEVQQAAQARQTEEHVREQLKAAQDEAAQQRAEAEKQGQ